MDNIRKNNLLRYHRLKQRLTQADVASSCELDIRQYQKYERGENIPNIRIAIKLADLLGVSDLREIWK